MESQRPHRSISTVEVGVADATAPHTGRHAVVHAAAPQWLVSYETARPRWLVECMAEFAGVFSYVYLGIGANLAFNITALAKENGFGSLLNIALAYGLGIAFGIIISGPTSGSQLSPGFTIAFALFKGFPWRKVPQYIIAQILGGFCGALLAYAQYSPEARQVVAGLNAVGQGAVNFTPAGPAGALAILPTPGQTSGFLFLNEFITTTLLAVLVFSVLDPSNIFVHFASAPLIIGMGFTAIILAFAVGTVTLNTARDLGGRFACGIVYGSNCFPMQFSAIAALTNIAGSIFGAALQVFFLSDHRRPHVNVPHPASVPAHGADTKTNGDLVAEQDVRHDEPYGDKANGAHHV